MIERIRIVVYLLTLFGYLLFCPLLGGCSSNFTELKAPCNYSGTFCGTKTAIN